MKSFQVSRTDKTGILKCRFRDQEGNSGLHRGPSGDSDEGPGRGSIQEKGAHLNSCQVDVRW
jgi:hypothetical protein